MIKIGNLQFGIKQEKAFVIGCEKSEKEIIIPSTIIHKGQTYKVEYIAGSVFKNCFNLTSITIPNSIITIGWNAFENCYNLKHVSIPQSVTRIESGAFYGCTSLTSITFEGTKAQWNAISKFVEDFGTWHDDVPATHVQCSDGQVAIQ
jgi:hypothetical protein